MTEPTQPVEFIVPRRPVCRALHNDTDTVMAVQLYELPESLEQLQAEAQSMIAAGQFRPNEQTSPMLHTLAHAVLPSLMEKYLWEAWRITAPEVGGGSIRATLLRNQGPGLPPPSLPKPHLTAMVRLSPDVNDSIPPEKMDDIHTGDLVFKNPRSDDEQRYPAAIRKNRLENSFVRVGQGSVVVFPSYMKCEVATGLDATTVYLLATATFSEPKKD